MKFNGNTLTAYGTIDTPWSADFAEVMEAVEGQAAAVQQNSADIKELQQSVENVNASAIFAVLENAAATAHAFAPADFDLLLIGATPASGHLTVCATIPAAAAAAGLAFQVADEQSYTKWNLTYTGVTRTEGTGTLTYIFGVKL